MVRRRRKNHGFHPDRIRRTVFYGAVLFLLAIVQCSFFARLKFLPVTPDLILGALLTILLLESPQAATVFALIGGFFLDALGGVGISWSPLLYWMTVVLLGFPAVKMMKNFRAWLLLMIPALLLRMGFGALELWLTLDGVVWKTALLTILLPEAWLTMLTAIPIYFCMRCWIRRTEEKKNRFRISP